jgi:hypothetical protein
MAVSDVKALACRLASYLPGNLHLQVYLGLLKIIQMPPVKVDRNDASKLSAVAFHRLGRRLAV